MFDISIQDYATPRLQRLIDGLRNPRPLYQMAGARVQECVRDYLIVLAGSRHDTAESLGAQPSGHLGKAAEKVARPSALHPIPDGISLSLNHPGMSRAFKDVTIRPGPDKKYLTIPAVAEAYNKRAYRFDNLEVLFGKNGPYALAERPQTKVRWRKSKGRTYAAAGEQRGGRIFYWLVKSAFQEQDRTLLPEGVDLHNAALAGARDFVNLLIHASTAA